MKIVLQRVLSAKVIVESKEVGSCQKGFCLLVGVEESDTIDSITKMAEKISVLRVFEDENGKMNKSILDINGSILAVSQFTLLADCSHGRRPSFTKAGDPKQASLLFDTFVQLLKNKNIPTQTGIFGADMLVKIQNHGPATFILES